ncbi:hypothetical protein RJT34_30187 [Clitoria ternatea]|uniref:Uncharacterized protein n=1 Tax=Clitoria ternatea TaxID=43366 RepID=A0AAN9I1R8_CLITE
MKKRVKALDNNPVELLKITAIGVQGNTELEETGKRWVLSIELARMFVHVFDVRLEHELLLHCLKLLRFFALARIK